MNSRFNKPPHNNQTGLRCAEPCSGAKTLKGEGYQKFNNISGIERLPFTHKPDADEIDLFEDPLCQKIDGDFVIIKESIEKHFEESGDRGDTALRPEKIVEAFKILFFDSSDQYSSDQEVLEQARIFLESRFYYGSQAPSPIDRLNLAYKEGTLDECLSLIKGTFTAVQQGAHF